MFGEYQLTAIDNMVIRVAKRAGISRKITNHTLRRTYGRLLYKAGVDIIEIADILGHSETRTTKRYLRIRLDNQKKAMAKRGDTQEASKWGWLLMSHKRKSKEGVEEDPPAHTRAKRP